MRLGKESLCLNLQEGDRLPAMRDIKIGNIQALLFTMLDVIMGKGISMVLVPR